MENASAATQGRYGKFTWLIVPAIAIGAARWAGHSSLALAYPRLAAALFLWIAADALTLTVMARSPNRRPAAHSVLACLASACIVVALSAPPSVRQGLGALPWLSAVMTLVVLAHLGWSAIRASKTWRSAQGQAADRFRAVAEVFLPGPLVRFASAEISLLHLALFKWGAEPDIPHGTRGFAYHRHLAPMVSVLLAIQVIEIAVMDLLVGLWNRYVASVLTAIGLAALVYMVGLIKSLRLRPILLTEEGLLVRAGILHERFISYQQIAGIAPSIEAVEVKDRTTLDMALLAWPNVLLRLRQPIARRPFLRTRPAITALAFKVDDPEAFLNALNWKLRQACA
ncbi:hypothetical protein SAMN05518801_11314 [Novosphingobium sp. CF614]|uniref:hypothetical protein n=1 Tax=Novosphingobium sp. CF614 TaxID=1884364 RepID=UPI0008E2A3FD|nr:hypothetical protein [Novosphingobium sp. CF614]SFG26895.1 hypothetical protein SAMN05518801_11314 [Novosphingobium sp. CF614]